MVHEAGKGDSPRKQQDQKAYDEGWDRIFRRAETEDRIHRKKPKENPIKDEPLKEDEND